MTAFVAQLGERKTEDLKVRGSIPRGGIFFYYRSIIQNHAYSSPSYCRRNFWKSFSSMTKDWVLCSVLRDFLDATEANLPSFLSISCWKMEQNVSQSRLSPWTPSMMFQRSRESSNYCLTIQMSDFLLTTPDLSALPPRATNASTAQIIRYGIRFTLKPRLLSFTPSTFSMQQRYSGGWQSPKFEST